MIFGTVLIFVLLVAPNGVFGTDWKKMIVKRVAQKSVAARPVVSEEGAA